MHTLYMDGNLLQLRPRGSRVFLLVGVLMLLSTPVWLFFLGQTTTLTCERAANGAPDCRLSRSLFGIATGDRPLDGLMAARLSQTTDSDGDTMYQVILETRRGDVPLTTARSSTYAPKARQVAEINDFANDRTAAALTVEAAGTVGLIVSAVLALVGAGFAFGGIQASATVWTFDRVQNVLIKQRRGLLPPKVWQYHLGDVQGAIVTSTRDSDGDRTYRVELVTHQGQRIPMTGWYSSGRRAKEETATLIQSFLDQA